MLTSWRIIAEQIQKIIEGRATSDSRYDLRELIRLAKGVASKLVFGEIRQAFVDGERTVDSHFLATYKDLVIKIDESTGDNYIDIPGSFMHLYGGQGIQRIVTVDKQGKRGQALIPIMPWEQDIYANLPAGALEGEFCFEADRTKIFFKNNDKDVSLTKKYPKVDVTLVSTDIFELKDTDQLSIPEEIFDNIIRGTLEILLPTKQIPVDVVNDNSSNIKVNG
jgi:hypothetical protein